MQNPTAPPHPDNARPQTFVPFYHVPWPYCRSAPAGLRPGGATKCLGRYGCRFYPAGAWGCWLGRSGSLGPSLLTVLVHRLAGTFSFPNTATPQGGALLATAIFAAMCALFCLVNTSALARVTN